MYYDLTNRIGYEAANNRLNALRKLGQSITIDVFKKTRTSQQNRALHVFFKQVSDILNNAGATMASCSGLETPYTETIIKEVWWKPIQLVMFGTKSTRKLSTDQINEIFDVINLHLSETIGESVEFPSIESLMNKNVS